ncbi:hypothetical protein F4813DRAFT_263897 [Daldinia decipiens]|uniref:uncharacterized protein n=1 Tax=Daldinia decipiens TaxID=326647 RepID=UPI0020C483BF|nr:uncharacterized protein F4813DRAFT_263897 [Daldinia decipiens]KAI1660793.1 hypothetical protein F4813DRAFT_263897 [Daldinia decipiens]
MELDIAPPFKTAGAPAVETGFGAVVLPGTVAGDVTVGVAVDAMLLLADEVGAGAGVELDSPLLLPVFVVLDVSVEVLALEDEEVPISEELREEKVLSEKPEDMLPEEPEEDIPSVGLEVEEAVLLEELIGTVVSEELEKEEELPKELEVEEEEDVPSKELDEDVLSGIEDERSDVEDELSGVEDDVAEKVGVFETTPVEVFGAAPLPVDPPGVLVTSPSGALWLEETGIASSVSQKLSH